MTRARVVVLGGGLSGLAIAYELVEMARADDLDLDVALYDENDWPGGKIRSVRQDGYTLEWGPNGFLDSKPATLELVDRLGLRDRLLPSDDAARRRFVFSRGQLRALPESPPTFLKSKLLSWPAKLRLVCEPFARKRPAGVDETVAEFARRRLGKQALARLIDPMVSGVFAGDPSRLSLAAAFPRIAEMEAEYGGLFKAMRRIGKARRAARERGEDAAEVGPAPGGRLTSFPDGLDTLPRAIADALGDRVHLGQRAESVERLPADTAGGARYRVRFTDGEAVEATTLVLALPAHASAALLSDVDGNAAALLGGTPYARLAVVGLGYPREGFPHPLDGFGFLAPHEEGRGILGALWTSSVFPGHRAPDSKVLVRCMVGGARAPERLDLDDDALVALVRDELQATMGVDVPPEHVAVFRHQHAIPGYPTGHLERLAELESSLVAAAPGLLLGGNAYRGIGINDCVAAAPHVARRALDVAAGTGDGAGFLTWS